MSSSKTGLIRVTPHHEIVTQVKAHIDKIMKEVNQLQIQYHDYQLKHTTTRKFLWWSWENVHYGSFDRDQLKKDFPLGTNYFSIVEFDDWYGPLDNTGTLQSINCLLLPSSKKVGTKDHLELYLTPSQAKVWNNLLEEI